MKEGLPRSPAHRAVFLAGMALLASFASPASTAAAGQPGAPVVEVAPEIQAAPDSETLVRVGVDQQKALPSQTVLIVRGLPPQAVLSEGNAFGPGVWVVPLAGASRIRLRTPGITEGAFRLSFSLVTLEGAQLATTQSMLIVGPSVPKAPTEQTSGAASRGRIAALGEQARAPQPPAPPASASPPPAPVDRNAILKLMQKAEESMQLGNVAVARHFYQEAAELGSREGAMALAATYDALELAQMKGVSGVEPDAEKARKWYEKARTLGDPQAESRLRRLAGPAR